MIKINRPRVILIDLYSIGHHSPYIQDLITGFNGLNIDYLVAAPPQLLDQLGINEKNTIPIDWDNNVSKLSGIKRQIKSSKIFIKLIKQTVDWQPTHIHFLFTDWHMA